MFSDLLNSNSANVSHSNCFEPYPWSPCRQTVQTWISSNSGDSLSSLKELKVKKAENGFIVEIYSKIYIASNEAEILKLMKENFK